MRSTFHHEQHHYTDWIVITLALLLAFALMDLIFLASPVNLERHQDFPSQPQRSAVVIPQ